MTTIHSADPEMLSNASVDTKDKRRGPDAKEATEAARDYAMQTSTAAMETAEAVASDVRAEVTKVTAAARDFAVKQPVATAAGALALGVLLGMAVNRRR
ncbi:hypothetical protein [Roseobacter denitrificans]|uniref:DUF883 domain-containing protein n=1 Tax=Roseobacter denitrificans (strain ATCC 33942 / OCh 114) TaxID=375451 RepID=Q166P7_ROSDO|nr:hypothetical protein [Roseobacter denitrificans]ABG32046.1 hypothetical protein RD1_2482 [Roseobacter denitrificans OCh 114]SFG36810.1 hypothetical protein SAMN05443635_114114 [Roseobacter denitrificans OCh 114]